MKQGFFYLFVVCILRYQGQILLVLNVSQYILKRKIDALVCIIIISQIYNSAYQENNKKRYMF